MEFWGVEVKCGTPLKVQPGEGMVIHLSQASLGEVKANKNESATLFVTVDGKKLVLGTLLSDKLPQQLFDLVFDRDFELSHNFKSASISFFGYKAINPVDEGEDEGFDSEDSEADISLVTKNGQPEIKAKAGKPVVAEKAKESKVKILEPTKAEDDDDSDEDDSDEDGSSDEDAMDQDGSDSDDGDSDEEDDTPKKEAAPSKKRGPDSAIKTPASQKKAKLVTPQKTDGKKSSGHVATPYPSKQAGKTPKTAIQQSPKSDGPFPCGPCNKTFSSEVGLASHTKAKHGLRLL